MPNHARHRTFALVATGTFIVLLLAVPGRPGYPDDLDKAIGPLTNFLWAFAARIGIVAFVLAAILFAISYWLFRPPRREA